MAPTKRKLPNDLIVADGLGIKFRTNRQKPFSTRVRETFTPAGKAAKRARGPEEFWALKDVSFTISPGEAVGLIGGNGHGKSTLLRLIAGVMIPDEGSVKVRGQVAPMIEVTGGFVGDLTVRDNIWLAAGLKGLTKKQIARRFDDIVEWAEIGHRLDTPFRHLSSGMKAKCGFSVVTQIDRPIVLVDEVLSVGDRAFRQKCYDRMEELRTSGKTIVLVSHSEAQIERFCQRAIYLRHGRLIADGPVEVVMKQYTDYVDQAIGEQADKEREEMERRRRKANRRARLEAEAAGIPYVPPHPSVGVPPQSTKPTLSELDDEPAPPSLMVAEGQLELDVQVDPRRVRGEG
jgi:ABC-2 type transport system ATP-binding protein